MKKSASRANDLTFVSTNAGSLTTRNKNQGISIVPKTESQTNNTSLSRVGIKTMVSLPPRKSLPLQSQSLPRKSQPKQSQPRKSQPEQEPKGKENQ